LASVSRNVSKGTGMPRVAVVVVNFNGGPCLERCLEALSRQTLRPTRTVVVDNASTDGSADGLASAHPDIEVIRLPCNIGFAAANNLGCKLAGDCEWLGLVNPDAFPEPAWLASLMKAALANPEYVCFGSLLIRSEEDAVVDGTGDVFHVSGFTWRRDGGQLVTTKNWTSEEVFSPCAAAAVYRRDVFMSVGGFDESFFCYHEDTDLAFRLRLRGHRCLFVADAVVHHVGFTSVGGPTSDFIIYHSYRNRVWMYLKNMPPSLLWMHLPEHLASNLIELASAVLRRQGHVALAAKRDAFRDLPRVLRERRHVQRTRKVRTRELRRVMGRGPHPYVHFIGRTWEKTRRAFSRTQSRGAK
jgi:GT2 family glycosyltransferase